MRSTVRFLCFTFSFLIAFSVLSASQVTYAYHNKWHEPDYSIYVEGKAIAFDTKPFLQDDRLMVPLRPLAEAMGAGVDYNDQTQTATVQKAQTLLVLDFKDGTVSKNGTRIDVNPRPQMVNDYTFVPLRFLSEAFDLPVSWDSDTNIVRVGPSQQTLEKWAPIRTALKQSRDAMNQLQSFTSKTAYEVHTQLPYALSKVDVSGDLNLVYHNNPLSFYLKTSPGDMTNVSKDWVPQLVQSWELFIGNGKSYLQDPSVQNGWEIDTLSKSDQEDLQKPFASFLTDDVIEKIVPYATLTEDGSKQLITLKYTEKDIRGLMQAEDAQSGYGYSSSTFNEEFHAKYVTAILTLDKATSRVTGLQVDSMLFYMTPVSIKTVSSLADFNSAPPVNIPAEALEYEKTHQ